MKQLLALILIISTTLAFADDIETARLVKSEIRSDIFNIIAKEKFSGVGIGKCNAKTGERIDFTSLSTTSWPNMSAVICVVLYVDDTTSQKIVLKHYPKGRRYHGAYVAVLVARRFHTNPAIGVSN